MNKFWFKFQDLTYLEKLEILQHLDVFDKFNQNLKIHK